MEERTYSSDRWMNEKSNLDYTAYFGRHVDQTANQVLAESRENLRQSEEILEQSRKELLQAQIALGNMELQNLMTQFAHYTAAQLHDKAFSLFWSTRSDVALSFPGFAYHGRQAVQGYLAGLRDKKQAKLEELAPVYPDVKVSEELLGAGFGDCLCLCTPYIVIAQDGQTAQGVWNLMRMASEEVAGEPKARSNYWFERWYVDFVRENGAWKLWHMTVREDLFEAFNEDDLPPGPMQLQLPRTGGNSPPGNINMGGMAPFMMGGPKTLSKPKEPSYPAPYETFDPNRFIQGMTRARNDVGTVPEYMMSLPFADAQQMGPPGPGGKKESGGPGGPAGPNEPDKTEGGEER